MVKGHHSDSFSSASGLLFCCLSFPYHQVTSCFNDCLILSCKINTSSFFILFNLFFRTVSSTRLGTNVNAARKVTMEMQPRRHAGFVRVLSVWPQTGGWKKTIKTNRLLNSCAVIKMVILNVTVRPAVLQWAAEKCSETSSAYAN